MALFGKGFNLESNPEQDFKSNIRRLSILENAVINYGGGVNSLRSRALQYADVIDCDYPEVSVFLRDVSAYLRDVVIAGDLDVN